MRERWRKTDCIETQTTRQYTRSLRSLYIRLVKTFSKTQEKNACPSSLERLGGEEKERLDLHLYTKRRHRR